MCRPPAFDQSNRNNRRCYVKCYFTFNSELGKNEICSGKFCSFLQMHPGIQSQCCCCELCSKSSRIFPFHQVWGCTVKSCWYFPFHCNHNWSLEAHFWTKNYPFFWDGVDHMCQEYFLQVMTEVYILIKLTHCWILDWCIGLEYPDLFLATCRDNLLPLCSL